MKKLFNHLTILLIGIYGLKLIFLHKLVYYISNRYDLFFTATITFVLLLGILGTVNTLKQIEIIAKNEKISYKFIFAHIPLYLLLLLGLFLPPKSLTSNFIGQKPTFITNNSNKAITKRIIHKKKSDYTFNDWYFTISTADDPLIINGDPVKITGLVAKDKSYLADVFLLSRFVVTCCAVDATPIGFPVKSENANKYNPDQWIEVAGQFAVLKDRNNIDRLFIIPTNIQLVKEPANPYVYDISWYYWGKSPPSL